MLRGTVYPLHLAHFLTHTRSRRYGHRRCLELLVTAGCALGNEHQKEGGKDAGADGGGFGLTALMWACRDGRTSCVETLLAAGAAVDECAHRFDGYFLQLQ